MKTLAFIDLIYLIFTCLGSHAAYAESIRLAPKFQMEQEEHEHGEARDPSLEFLFAKASGPQGCRAATVAQRASVDTGRAKELEFLRRCQEATDGSPWCEQLVRPNPVSAGTFACTYGKDQARVLIHPDETTWTFAFQAVLILQDLETEGVGVDEIYNWWRPEPYNQNVSGAKGRHPFGTSVDVRFSTLEDMEKAHQLLCQFRSEGRLRALGYYGNLGLHLGIGDARANTWGKNCPQGEESVGE